MPRGNPDNLRAAAQRKRHEATARAQTALEAMVAAGELITFRGLARRAHVSVDFLYRSPLRARVEQLRAHQQTTQPPATHDSGQTPPGGGGLLAALSAQLRELKRRHRDEVSELTQALAAAHGENLELRRALGHRQRHNSDTA